MAFAPATRPTLHFIGVTTAQSSIMRVFPAWAEALGLDAAINGIDFPLDPPAADYRRAVAFIRDDALSRGALVTTHKINLFHACRDLFDDVDPLAQLTDEISCIAKRDDRLVCHAKDPISSGLALDGFLPPGHFARERADLLVIGAGGSSAAITWHLMRRDRGANVPARIVVTDRSRARLDALRRIHAAIPTDVALDHVLVPDPTGNDRVLATLAPGSLVINASGLGKDAPGSPLGPDAVFPERAIAWDLNYRGALVFLDQARAQASERSLRVENGWSYFIHGWTQVIAEVFGVAIPPRGALIDRLAAMAADIGGERTR